MEPVQRPLIDAPDASGKATGPRHGDFAYDVPITVELDSMLRNNPDLLTQIKAASDAWALEAPASGSSRVLSDLPDGAIMQCHPELGRCTLACTHARRMQIRVCVRMGVHVRVVCGACTCAWCAARAWHATH